MVIRLNDKGEIKLAHEETIRYKATIAYDGTDFSGFQVQPSERTVQGEMEAVLKKINKGKFIRLHPSGRTDAGAHAAGMVFHFDYTRKIPEKGLFKAINTLISPDISLLKLERVADDFHARYHAKGKTYIYRIHNHELRDPFKRNFAYHHAYQIDKDRVEKALDILIGTHDFTSFCSTKTDKENKIRTIYDIVVEHDRESDEWQFIFYGNGFLYNMIRIIMGTVLPIADGRKEVEEMFKILEARDRNAAGKTLSANGLCLEKVHY